MSRIKLGALAIAGSLFLSPAVALASNVLWAGSDGFVDVTQIGSMANCANSFTGGTGHAVAAIGVSNTTSTSDPPSNRAQTATFTSVGGLWIHANIRIGNSTSTNNVQGLLIRSPDGVARILLRQTGTFGIFKLSTRNAAGTITDVATATTPAVTTATVTALDLHVDYAGGAAELYLGTSNQVISFSGSLETDAATTLNQVEFMGLGNGATQTGGGADCGSTPTAWSEVIIADTQDTRGMVLMPVNPAANGTTQNCSSGTAGNLTDDSDATVVSSASNNQVCGFTTGTSFPSGTWNVLAVAQNARVLRSSTGPQDFDWYNRTADGTDHLAGLTVNPGLTAAVFNHLWLTNPHTSVAWAATDIVSGFNLGFKSLP